MVIDKHYQENKQQYIDRAARWAKANPERRKEIVNKYNQSRNKSKLAEWHQNKKFGRIVERTECCDCGEALSESGRNLVVHHVDGNNGKLGKPLNNNPDNLVVLCRGCHPKYHYNGEIRRAI